MIIQKISGQQETCYDILNVKEDASYEEIRSGYRSLLLTLHPDKLPTSSYTQNPKGESGKDHQFLKVQRAWEILNDSKSRSLYDKKLKAERYAAMVVADDISLDDMIVEEEQVDDGEEIVLGMYYQCRCGDYVSVNSSDLKEMGYELTKDGKDKVSISLFTPDGFPGTVVLPCGSCSLIFRLLLDLSYEGSIDE